MGHDGIDVKNGVNLKTSQDVSTSERNKEWKQRNVLGLIFHVICYFSVLNVKQC